jgi:hypothetical protein
LETGTQSGQKCKKDGSHGVGRLAVGTVEHQRFSTQSELLVGTPRDLGSTPGAHFLARRQSLRFPFNSTQEPVHPFKAHNPRVRRKHWRLPSSRCIESARSEITLRSCTYAQPGASDTALRLQACRVSDLGPDSRFRTFFVSLRHSLSVRWPRVRCRLLLEEGCVAAQGDLRFAPKMDSGYFLRDCFPRPSNNYSG